jgi:hypothetical protein
MPKYEISLVVNVPAFKEVEVEAETAEEAQAKAIQDAETELRTSPTVAGAEYEIEWQARDNVQVNEIKDKELS